MLRNIALPGLKSLSLAHCGGVSGEGVLSIRGVGQLCELNLRGSAVHPPVWCESAYQVQELVDGLSLY